MTVMFAWVSIAFLAVKGTTNVVRTCCRTLETAQVESVWPTVRIGRAILYAVGAMVHLSFSLLAPQLLIIDHHLVIVPSVGAIE